MILAVKAAATPTPSLRTIVDKQPLFPYHADPETSKFCREFLRPYALRSLSVCLLFKKVAVTLRSQDFLLNTKELAGISLVHASPAAAAHELCSLAKTSRDSGGYGFHLVNAYTMALAHQDPEYAKLLNSSSANFPDGKPLTWWKHSDGLRLQQIRGPQLFEDVMDLGRSKNVRHYLLGSSTETLSLLQESLRRRYPGVNIVGMFSPPFREMSSEEIQRQDEAIARTKAEIVWVGLGTPKQDWEVGRIAANLPVLSVAVGAAFDFSAGTKRKSPEWISSLGLEWLFRLIAEPRRLWKRYLIGNFVFLWSVISHRIKK